MAIQISRSLLHRFSRGRCTPEEQEAVRQWLNEEDWPPWKEDEKIPDAVRRAIWAKLHGRMGAGGGSRLRKRLWPWAGAAAAALIGAFWLAGVFSPRSAAVGPQIFTASGQASRVMLPDSSVVFLAAHSTLTLNRSFGNGGREVILRGEGAFEVTGDPAQPFSVLSGDVRTTALGTSFKVMSFEEGRKIKIVLSSGRVKVEDQGASGGTGLVLDPGDEAVYDRVTRTLRKKTGPLPLDYRSDVLFFRNAGLKETADKLSNYYHIQVRYEALPADWPWKVSGEFDYKPLETVMKAIAYSCNIRYVMQGDTLVLLPVP